VILWHSSTLAVVMPQRFGVSGAEICQAASNKLREPSASCASRADRARQGRWRTAEGSGSSVVNASAIGAPNPQRC
jgi:hypothetical protein